MKFTRIAPKKSFSFLSLPLSQSQAHFFVHSQLKASEKLLPESLRTQFEKKKTEFKDDQNTSSVLSTSEGALFGLFSLVAEKSSFEKHEFLRKTFRDFIKKDAPLVYVNLSTLKAEEALFWVDAIASLAELEPWSHPKITKKKEEKKAEFPEIYFYTNLSEKQFDESVRNATACAQATNLVRTLALTASNHLHPKEYRQKIQAVAKDKKLKFEFWDRKELLKKNAGAFLAVTQADPNDEGGIVKLVYKPKTTKSKSILTLVGKGLCFDTGGYNIKTGNYMNGMHEDMTGSAIALASIGMLSDMQFPLEVHAYLAVAENHISPTGYKPNDVVFASNGTSIEVDNTDAEGRMVLADTLALSSKEKPGLIIDYATLTGACFRALSTARSGAFSNRKSILARLHNFGETAGERLWTFPMGEDYEKGLESEYADLRQCAAEVNADHIYAATFLNHFVDKDVPWIHIDLSSHAHKGGLGLVSSETNGFGCRLTRQLAEGFLKKTLG